MEKCFICNKQFKKTEITTGYGIDHHGHKLCFDCIGKLDRKKLYNMPIGGKTILYHIREKTGNDTYRHFVSNCSGTFKNSAILQNIGRHNIAGKRYDLDFVLKDENGNVIKDKKGKMQWFHGTRYGDMTEILHVRKVKPII